MSTEKIKSKLKSGNCLIHCTHGADRTGAVIGRYYIDFLKWDVERAITDAKKYKAAGKLPASVIRFIKEGPAHP